jgi:hypothetical protein
LCSLWNIQLAALIKAPINRFNGDGAYDVEQVYTASHRVGAIPIVPPRKDAKPQNPKRAIAAKIPRDFIRVRINA